MALFTGVRSVFNGTLNIGFGNQFQMNTGGLHNAGVITLTGAGEYHGESRMHVHVVTSFNA